MPVLILPPAPATSSKYRAQKVAIDGEVFDSQREADRYGELKHLNRCGVVKDLRCHVPFVLYVAAPDGSRVKIGTYAPDFVFAERGPTRSKPWILRVEDVKGVRTQLYRWKRKHFEAQTGLTIHEV